MKKDRNWEKKKKFRNLQLGMMIKYNNKIYLVY